MLSRGLVRVSCFPKGGLQVLRASLSRKHGPNALVAPEALRNSIKSPWVPVKDPNNSALVYYWNKETNETTAVGQPKPVHWVEIADPAGSSLTYWWNPDNNQTTALGEPKPTTSLAIPTQPQQQVYQQLPPQTLGGAMKTYFALGAGMSAAFAIVGALFR